MAKKRSSNENNDMTMKIVIFAAMLLVFVGGYLIARAKYKPQILELTKMVNDKDRSMQVVKSNANKIMMKDDSMWVVENGLVKEMDSDIMLSNGDKVTVEGKILKSDNSEVTLKNGESVGMDGIMQKNEESTTDSVEF